MVSHPELGSDSPNGSNLDSGCDSRSAKALIRDVPAHVTEVS